MLLDKDLVTIIASVLMGQNPNEHDKSLIEYVQLAEHRVQKIKEWYRLNSLEANRGGERQVTSESLGGIHEHK